MVVGAGPAGSRTARNLARDGFDVLLVDDHATIGEPCHCSGLVTPRTLEVAEAGSGLTLNSIRGATFQTRTGEPLQLTGNVDRALVIDRLMFVGDAARQVKPASGGGILTALVSAEVAAEEASRALHEGDLSAGRLTAYSRAWDRRVGRELQRQHDMRRALSRLDDRKLRSLLDTLTNPKVRARMEASGDIDFPSKLVWRLIIHHPAIVLRNLVAPRFPFAWLFPGETKLAGL